MNQATFFFCRSCIKKYNLSNITLNVRHFISCDSCYLLDNKLSQGIAMAKVNVPSNQVPHLETLKGILKNFLIKFKRFTLI